MTDLILTYEDAVNAIYDDDVEDWDTLTRNLPRNHLPAVLAELAFACGLIHEHQQLALALTDAWVMCEFPEQALSREQWMECFCAVGYIVNGNAAEPPEQVTLYRGGISPDRMAWTSNRYVAEWFRDRWPNGKLWTASVQADRLLAHFNKERLDESGRSENEYVIDPSGLAYMEVR